MENNVNKGPIDLFSVPTVSEEGFAFPIEEFLPNLKKEPLDEPADNSEESEVNVEVNPNTPETTKVDVAETGVIDGSIEFGSASFESLIQDSFDLCNARDQILSNQGISRSDVVSLESRFGPIITPRFPINGFSSHITKTGLTVSTESIGNKILDMIEKLIAAIGRAIDRILGGDVLVMPTMGGGISEKTNQDRWNSILEVAAELDSVANPKINFSTLYPGSSAASRSGTAKHFAKLYAEELMRKGNDQVATGINLVINHTADVDLEKMTNQINQLLANANTQLVHPTPLSDKHIPSIRIKYATLTPARFQTVERMVELTIPTETFKKLQDDTAVLKNLHRDVKQRFSKSTNADDVQKLKNIAKIIAQVDQLTVNVDQIKTAYQGTNNIVKRALNTIEVDFDRLKVKHKII